MANMGSTASLVMSITTCEHKDEASGGDQQQKGQKLWGLVVFGVQLNKEVELAAQTKRSIFYEHRLFVAICFFVMHQLVSSPSHQTSIFPKPGLAAWNDTYQVADKGYCHMAYGVYHDGSTGLSTDSMTEAGYPGAAELGDAVCGMAAIKITSRDFIFWFRLHTTKEIKWGGAKHEPIDKDDEYRRMHPHTSFKAFLEIMKQRSLPWEDIEMDAIHSLQLILRGSLQGDTTNDDSEIIVNAPPPDDGKKIQWVDELHTITNEVVRLNITASVPIWAIDASGNINGWNSKAADLTGLPMQEAIGMPLIDLVEDDSVEVAKKVLQLALRGEHILHIMFFMSFSISNKPKDPFPFGLEHILLLLMTGKEEKNIEIKLKSFSNQDSNSSIILVVNSCCSHDMKDSIVGVCFVGQDVTRQKLMMDKNTRIQNDYVAVVQNPSELIPPIFIIDESG
ncbi:hypothetical protein C4D60_Mb04t39490 [Musa balbisiana]|uniref:PAS domain-containing protein n=1 Tax=Musa balbisiana TaxID=52838 RepID=A0A4S8KI20_MUSBA|nr:hypothetical protein C4D60_Mb04t39490 [Musa balbisiana]